jgi:HSP20 family molecular chaperone IbpA
MEGTMMAMIEKTNSEIAEERSPAPYRIYPEIYRHVNYPNDMVQIEVILLGVKKEDIVVKALPTWLHLSAMRTSDNVEYSANVSFGVEVIPEETTAEYKNGLLKIQAKIRDPLSYAKEVPL